MRPFQAGLCAPMLARPSFSWIADQADSSQLKSHGCSGPSRAGSPLRSKREVSNEWPLVVSQRWWAQRVGCELKILCSGLESARPSGHEAKN